MQTSPNRQITTGYTVPGYCQHNSPCQQPQQPVYNTCLRGKAATAEVHLMRAHEFLVQAEQWLEGNQCKTEVGIIKGRNVMTGGERRMRAITGEKYWLRNAQKFVHVAMLQVQAAAALYPYMLVVHCALVPDNTNMAMLFSESGFSNMSEQRKLDQSTMSVQNMMIEIDRNINILRSQGDFFY